MRIQNAFYSRGRRYRAHVHSYAYWIRRCESYFWTGQSGVRKIVNVKGRGSRVPNSKHAVDLRGRFGARSLNRRARTPQGHALVRALFFPPIFAQQHVSPFYITTNSPQNINQQFYLFNGLNVKVIFGIFQHPSWRQSLSKAISRLD